MLEAISLLSRSGIHAVRALVALAQLPEGEFKGAAALAEKTDAPPNYLGKLLQALAREGLVQSQKGLGGGFRLARDPDDITITDLPAIGVQVVDGDSVDFLLDPVLVGAGGDFTVDIVGNVISGLAGGANDSFQSTFLVDAVPPRVESTLWNGLPLLDNRTLPSGNLVFSATFDEALDPTLLDESDLSIFDETSLETLPALGIFYDETSNTLSAGFGLVTEGKYTLTLSSRDEAFERQLSVRDFVVRVHCARAAS